MGICAGKYGRGMDIHNRALGLPEVVEAGGADGSPRRGQPSQSGALQRCNSEGSDISDEEPSPRDGPSPATWAEVSDEADRRRKKLITDKWAKIRDYYDLDKRALGTGAYGYVCKATSKETGAVRAVKCLSKARARETRRRYRQEIAIMKMTDHPNIIKLFETFEDKKNIFLVLELCTGGDLLRHLLESGPLTEVRAATVMEQILRPVFYMHEKRLICHRDIKMENLLLLTKEPVEENTVKIIDFGFSCTLDPGEVMSTKLGTASYSSPQVLAGQYDEACDLWSCGVILYMLLCGQPPFQGKCDAEVMQAVRRGNYAFKGPVWEKASEDSKDLIRKLLRYDPQDRYNAEQALAHVWIRRRVPRNPGIVGPLRPSLLLDLRSFCMQNRLRRGALQIVAQHLSEDETKALRRAFVALDVRGTGILQVEDIQVASTLRSEMPELQEVLQALAAGSGGGGVGYSDFLAAKLEARHYRQDGACRAAFRAFDRNGDGLISRDELLEALSFGGECPTEAEAPDRVVAEVLRQVDSNGDGAIDFEEFRVMLRGDGPR